jgi:hypothetical protein
MIQLYVRSIHCSCYIQTAKLNKNEMLNYNPPDTRKESRCNKVKIAFFNVGPCPLLQVLE